MATDRDGRRWRVQLPPRQPRAAQADEQINQIQYREMKMNANHFESRIETRDNTMIFTTDGQQLTLFVEGDDGQGTYANLTPEKVHELKAVVRIWERLYFSGAFENK